jgi:hypothetical protein
MGRWHVEVTYLAGVEPSVFNVEELEELQGIIECGPDRRMIDKITVRYDGPGWVAGSYAASLALSAARRQGDGRPPGASPAC